MTTVLDASALLAWLQGENGADVVDEALMQGAVIHVVNWAEVLTRLASKGLPAAEATRQLSERGILGQLLTVDLGTLVDAEVVADLFGVTRGAGLSLGDRYCLTLAQRLGVPVLTADQQWANVSVDITIQVIR